MLDLTMEEAVEIIFTAIQDQGLSKKQVIRLALSFAWPHLVEDDVIKTHLTGLLTNEQLALHMEWEASMRQFLDEKSMAQGE
jgi:enolase